MRSDGFVKLQDLATSVHLNEQEADLVCKTGDPPAQRAKVSGILFDAPSSQRENDSFQEEDQSPWASGSILCGLPALTCAMGVVDAVLDAGHKGLKFQSQFPLARAIQGLPENSNSGPRGPEHRRSAGLQGTHGVAWHK